MYGKDNTLMAFRALFVIEAIFARDTGGLVSVMEFSCDCTKRRDRHYRKRVAWREILLHSNLLVECLHSFHPCHASMKVHEKNHSTALNSIAHSLVSGRCPLWIPPIQGKISFLSKTCSDPGTVPRHETLHVVAHPAQHDQASRLVSASTTRRPASNMSFVAQSDRRH